VTPDEVVARERRFALPVALAALAAVVAFVAAIAVNQSGGLADADNDAEFLVAFEGNSGSQLLSAVLQALGMLLAIAPLFYLFRAAAARSDAVRSALIGVTVAGPLFLAVGAVLQWFAFDSAATEFAGSGGSADVAEELIQDQATFDAAQGFTFAGTLGMVVAVMYASLHAMRTGLLTRFWGTLGMALGVSLLFLGFIGILVYVLALGILIGGWWPGGRPPAWEAGKAIPWPKPGEPKPDEPQPDERPPDPDEAALPSAEHGAQQHPVAAGSDPPPRKRKRRSDDR
jgi:hypothetical protein